MEHMERVDTDDKPTLPHEPLPLITDLMLDYGIEVALMTHGLNHIYPLDTKPVYRTRISTPHPHYIHCLLGEVLKYALVECYVPLLHGREAWRYITKHYNNAPVYVLCGRVINIPHINTKAALQEMQHSQDMGKTWGECVDVYYEVLDGGGAA